SFAAARQVTPALPTGCWQTTLVPSHLSSVQGLPSSGHAVPDELTASAGQVALEPVHVSAGSHASVEARQVVPALPAGCWQATFAPSHLSRVQTLPSSVQAVPFVLTALAGQAPLD